MIEIDGSQGEGGGQILRTSLALSAVTGKAFEVRNIRGKRKRSGLLKQHLTALGAAREICGAGVTGAELGSSHIVFAPGPIQTRHFDFEVRSAGSATLVAQTVLPALMFAETNSSFTVSGGTHNDMSPPFDFLERAYLPQIAKMGPNFRCSIDSYGFYPRGGGKFSIEIEPSARLQPLKIVERVGPTIPKVTALVAQLPREIGNREVDVIRRKANWKPNRCFVREVNSPGPGNVVMIELISQNVTEIFTGFGRQGVRAEDIARAVYREASRYLESASPVGEYLADQLLLPMSLAAIQGLTSRFRTGPLSLHTLTHIDVLKKFLDIEITVSEITDSQFEIGVAKK